MDISDLLAFKPETIPKRKQDEDEDGDGKSKAPAPSMKKPKFDEKILELIESSKAGDDDEESEVLDENGLKKLSLVFEKRVLNNQKMRLKYPDDPQKFMVSTNSSDVYIGI
jgi:beta-catenin-like protein 1